MVRGRLSRTVLRGSHRRVGRETANNRFERCAVRRAALGGTSVPRRGTSRSGALPPGSGTMNWMGGAGARVRKKKMSIKTKGKGACRRLDGRLQGIGPMLAGRHLSDFQRSPGDRGSQRPSSAAGSTRMSNLPRRRPHSSQHHTAERDHKNGRAGSQKSMSSAFKLHRKLSVPNELQQHSESQSEDLASLDAVALIAAASQRARVRNGSNRIRNLVSRTGMPLSSVVETRCAPSGFVGLHQRREDGTRPASRASKSRFTRGRRKKRSRRMARDESDSSLSTTSGSDAPPSSAAADRASQKRTRPFATQRLANFTPPPGEPDSPRIGDGSSRNTTKLHDADKASVFIRSSASHPTAGRWLVPELQGAADRRRRGETINLPSFISHADSRTREEPEHHSPYDDDNDSGVVFIK